MVLQYRPKRTQKSTGFTDWATKNVEKACGFTIPGYKNSLKNIGFTYLATEAVEKPMALQA